MTVEDAPSMPDARPSSAEAVAPPAQGRSLPAGRVGAASDTSGHNRWFFSLLISALVHLMVAGVMMLNWSFRRPSDASPPAAMVVELSVMPSSPAVPSNERPPGPEQTEAAPKPKPADQQQPKFDPPPQVDPAIKPDFALPVKQDTKPIETPAVAKQVQMATAPQAIQAPVKDKSAAPVEGNNAAPPSDAEQAWEGRILAKLERNKRYPSEAQSAGQQDTVFVRLVIDRKGKLTDASLKKSAGFPLLDGETLSLARRGSPFPPPPDTMTGDQTVLIVPVEFYLAKRR